MLCPKVIKRQRAKLQENRERLAFGNDLNDGPRLLTAVVLDPDQRAVVAKAICDKLAQANGPTKFVLPVQGFHEWDRPGAPLCNPAGLGAFCASLRANFPSNASLIELDCHINDALFSNIVFDLAVELAKP